jgi:hypothetical protein
MRLIFRIALPLVGLATMLVVGLAGAQTKKRVVELKAPIINEKEIKVECVHTYPHMVLRSKINESAVFTIATEATVKNTDCRQVGGRYTVAPGQRCTVFFVEESTGATITQVSAETSSTRYAFNGNWPIYACCRGKLENKELETSKGPHSKEGPAEIQLGLNNKAINSGTVYRGYEITLYPDRVDSHNREKDSNNPFSANIDWKSRKFLKGPCAPDDK